MLSQSRITTTKAEQESLLRPLSPLIGKNLRSVLASMEWRPPVHLTTYALPVLAFVLLTLTLVLSLAGPLRRLLLRRRLPGPPQRLFLGKLHHLQPLTSIHHQVLANRSPPNLHPTST